jgi:hypothetical protein
MIETTDIQEEAEGPAEPVGLDAAATSSCWPS